MILCAEEFKPSITLIEPHTGLYFDEIEQIVLSYPMESCKFSKF